MSRRRARLVWLALGVLLTATGAGAWIASCYVVSYRSGGASPYTIALDRGVFWGTNAPTFFPPGWDRLFPSPRVDGITWWPERVYSRTRLSTGETMHIVWVPLWPIVAAGLLLVGGAWVCSRRARRRESAHACAACGYSRAGLKNAHACPECGAAWACLTE